MEIRRINIIGFGNVGRNLFLHLDNLIEIKSLFTRSITEEIIEVTDNRIVSNLELLSKDVDLNIISSTDTAISDIAKQLPKDIPVVHTSGSISKEVFSEFEFFGVLYPLQTFTKGRILNLKEVPFLLEANSKAFGKELETLTSNYISKNISFYNSIERENIHVSAVFVNNFTTLMAREAKQILGLKSQDFSILKPLLKETVSKILDLDPDHSQTGPAQRNDEEVIQKHLSLLKDSNQKEIYEILSRRIMELKD